MAIRVRALRLGYYGDIRRRVGDIFNIQDEKHFSTRWMERLDPKPLQEAEPVEPKPRVVKKTKKLEP